MFQFHLHLTKLGLQYVREPVISTTRILELLLRISYRTLSSSDTHHSHTHF
jgi:hypothetical protein